MDTSSLLLYNIVEDIPENSFIMTKKNVILGKEFRCFLDKNEHFLDDENENIYDYILKYNSYKNTHYIYNKTKKIATIKMIKNSSYLVKYECNVYENNETFFVVKTFFKFTSLINPHPIYGPFKLIYKFNDNLLTSVKPRYKNHRFYLNFTNSLNNHIKTSSCNFKFINNDGDILLESIKIKSNKSKYVITSSDEISPLHSFIISCINKISEINI